MIPSLIYPKLCYEGDFRQLGGYLVLKGYGKIMVDETHTNNTSMLITINGVTAKEHVINTKLPDKYDVYVDGLYIFTIFATRWSDYEYSIRDGLSLLMQLELDNKDFRTLLNFIEGVRLDHLSSNRYDVIVSKLLQYNKTSNKDYLSDALYLSKTRYDYLSRSGFYTLMQRTLYCYQLHEVASEVFKTLT